MTYYHVFKQQPSGVMELTEQDLTSEEDVRAAIAGAHFPLVRVVSTAEEFEEAWTAYCEGEIKKIGRTAAHPGEIDVPFGPLYRDVLEVWPDVTRQFV